jgi:hypothetical protein
MLPLLDGAQTGTNEGAEIENTRANILTLEDGAYFQNPSQKSQIELPPAQIKMILNGGVYVAHRLLNQIMFLQGPRKRSKPQGGTEILLL